MLSTCDSQNYNNNMSIACLMTLCDVNFLFMIVSRTPPNIYIYIDDICTHCTTCIVTYREYTRIYYTQHEMKQQIHTNPVIT